MNVKYEKRYCQNIAVCDVSVLFRAVCYVPLWRTAFPLVRGCAAQDMQHCDAYHAGTPVVDHCAVTSALNESGYPARTDNGREKYDEPSGVPSMFSREVKSHM